MKKCGLINIFDYPYYYNTAYEYDDLIKENVNCRDEIYEGMDVKELQFRSNIILMEYLKTDDDYKKNVLFNELLVIKDYKEKLLD